MLCRAVPLVPCWHRQCSCGVFLDVFQVYLVPFSSNIAVYLAYLAISRDQREAPTHHIKYVFCKQQHLLGQLCYLPLPSKSRVLIYVRERHLIRYVEVVPHGQLVFGQIRFRLDRSQPLILPVWQDTSCRVNKFSEEGQTFGQLLVNICSTYLTNWQAMFEYISGVRGKVWLPLSLQLVAVSSSFFLFTFSIMEHNNRVKVLIDLQRQYLHRYRYSVQSVFVCLLYILHSTYRTYKSTVRSLSIDNDI